MVLGEVEMGRGGGVILVRGREVRRLVGRVWVLGGGGLRELGESN